MTLMLQCRFIALLLAAALVTACGGGATSEGIGGGGGGGGATGANAFLSGLALACGDPALTTCNNMQLIVGEGFAQPDPGFLPGAAALPTNPLFDYRSTQSALIDAIRVTPTAVVNGVAITVNGITVTSAATSPPIPLAAGVETEIAIVVTGLNGITQLTYRLFVTRLALDNADLSALTLSSGPLTPAFSPATTSYTNTVAFSVANVRVAATPLEASATFRIAGQAGVAGEESALIPVVIGDNAIEIVVTALDGVTTKTYTITVTRRGSSNLSALSLSGLTEGPPAQPVEMFLDPAFVATSTRNAYTVHAENRAVEVVITATAEAPGAVIRINGIEAATGVASAPIPLPKTGVGEGDANTIAIVVTHPASGSGDPLTRTYTLSVFRQLPPLFEAEAYLKPFDEGAGFESGISVALSADGSTLAVGAPAAGAGGAVYVYLFDNGNWTEQGPLLRPATLADGDSFGQSLALSASGDTLAVGAPARLPGGDPGENPLIGAVYVFTRQNGVWSEQAVIESFKLAGDDGFGYSVALSGDGLTLAIGAPDDPGGVGGVQNPASVVEDELAAGSGAAYVYTFNGVGWSPQVFIKSPAPKFPTQGQEEFFGHSVALSTDGNLLAVGMPGDSSNATGIDGVHNPDAEALGQLSGAVRLYRRDAATWQTTSTYVKAQVIRSGNRFGTTVAFSADGGTLAVGEPPQSSNTRGIWDSSDDIIDTGPASTAPAAGNSGAAYIFRRDVDEDWFQQAFFKASNTRPGARFGTGIALSGTGDAFVVGAPGEGSAATTVDGNQLNTSAPGSGAAYAFVFGAEAEVTRTPKVAATPASPPPEPVPPDPAVAVTATAGDGKITMSWTPLRGAISYNIYLSDNIEVSQSDFTTKYTDVSSPFDLTGLTNGVTYYAVVTVVSRVWTQTAYLKAPNSLSLALMGTSVALSATGDRIAAGALGDPRPETGVFNDVPYPTATTAPNRGAAYLFRALPEALPPP